MACLLGRFPALQKIIEDSIALLSAFFVKSRSDSVTSLLLNKVFHAFGEDSGS
jgi:hypothetical protein